MAIKKTLNIFAIVVAMMFNQIVVPMNVKAYDDVDETEIVCYYSEYEDDSEDYEVDEDYEEEYYEETDEDYEEASSEAEVWEDWDIFFGYTEFDDEDEEIDEDEDFDYEDDDEEEYDDEEDDDEDEDDEDEWVDDCDDEDWDDDEDYPDDDDDDDIYEYDITPTYVEDRLTASCLNDSEQAQIVADTYGFTLLSYDNGVALFDTNGQDPLSYVNGDIELPDGLYFQLLVETEFEPIDDDDFKLPTDDDGEDDGYTDGIEIGVEPSEEIIEENFEIGIDE